MHNNGTINRISMYYNAVRDITVANRKLESLAVIKKNLG